MPKKSPQELEFIKSIHDNVHGNIQLTELELKLIKTQEFQRLRDIKQLGLSDFVFPGAIHNRFSHSLGVMHIADLMICSLQSKGKFHDDNIRQKCRIAGLLHDIGHYPWSHIVEHVVNKDSKDKFGKNPLEIIQIDDSTDDGETSQTVTELDSWNESINHSKTHEWNQRWLSQRNEQLDFAHHERISGIVIEKTEIKNILLGSEIFDEPQIIDIAQIIAGVSTSPEGLIIHSELDADRFDYLLRDSKNTGVTYGLFDMQRIIQYLDYNDEIEPTEGNTGIFVHKKAQKAVEDFLMARYFLYSTIIFQKASIGFNKLATIIYEGLLERKQVYSYKDLLDIFDENRLDDYYKYTDSYIISKINQVVKEETMIDDSEDYQYSSELIKSCCKKYTLRDPLKLVKEEQTIYSKHQNKTRPIYTNKGVIDAITRSAEVEKEWYIISEIDQGITSLSPFVSLSDANTSNIAFAESIRILDHHNNPKLLVEDDASIIKKISEYKLNIVGIYTKNDEYKSKLVAAIEEYSTN